MVDANDIASVSALLSQHRGIVQTLAALDHDTTRINSMILSGPDTTPPNVQIFVDTRFMSYPPQMVAGIKDLLKARDGEIIEELAGFGVTGVALEVPPLAPAAAPLAAHTTPKPAPHKSPPPPKRRR